MCGSSKRRGNSEFTPTCTLSSRNFTRVVRRLHTSTICKQRAPGGSSGGSTHYRQYDIIVASFVQNHVGIQEGEGGREASGLTVKKFFFLNLSLERGDTDCFTRRTPRHEDRTPYLL